MQSTYIPHIRFVFPGWSCNPTLASLHVLIDGDRQMSRADHKLSVAYVPLIRPPAVVRPQGLTTGGPFQATYTACLLAGRAIVFRAWSQASKVRLDT